MPELRGEVTEEMDDFVDSQVDKGFYPSRAELQRDAIRMLMRKPEVRVSTFDGGGEI